jgi:hypothetical protein
MPADFTAMIAAFEAAPPRALPRPLNSQ